MRRTTNTAGIEESTGFTLCAKGQHNFQIVRLKDKTTSNGDPMVSIGMTVVNGQSAGAWVWDNIVLPLPGSLSGKIWGRTKHFLHCIGEPYEGEISYDSERWMLKKVTATVSHEEPNKHHKDKKAIISSYILDDDTPEIDISPSVDTAKEVSKELDKDCPF